MLVNGDCLEEVQKLVDEGVQVDSIVTDPPYHLTSIVDRFGKASIDDDTLTSKKVRSGADSYSRLIRTGFMGKEWDGGDIAFRKETWELFMKVLKPGGHLLAFSGSRTYHKMAVAIEDAGFDIRDQIMWLYGSGFPKSLNIGKSVDKKLGNERIKTGQTKTHSNKGMPQAEERTAIGAGAFGQEVEEEITVGTSEWEGWGTALKPAHEPIVMARKPLSENSIVANVLKHRTGGIHIDACRNELRFPTNVMHNGLEEDWARYFYCPKTSKAEKDKGLDSFADKPVASSNQAKAELKRGNIGWQGNLESEPDNNFNSFNKVEMKKNTHPTVKPVKLMRYLCRLITPKGGTVLDPFMGSGSTGIAAKDEGFEFIGIEREKEYFEIAERRVSVASPLEEFMK